MKLIKAAFIFCIVFLLFSCVAEKNLEWGWHHYDRGNACKGVKFFRKAALQGDAEAIYMMAYVQEHGECLTKNLDNALALYTSAASKGHLKAQAKTGEIYYQGEWVKKDYKQAGYWYEKAAEQGDAYSQYVTGYMYVNGQGTKKNYIQGVKWLQLSVEQKGNTSALRMLGKMYETGDGLPKDSDKALELYTKAAQDNDPKGQYELGRMLYSVQNYTASFKWFKKSAEQSNKNALYMVGVMYHNGDGMKYDSDTAAQWFSKSIRNGSQDGLNALIKLEKSGNSVAKRELCSLYKDQKIEKNNYIEQQCKGQ